MTAIYARIVGGFRAPFPILLSDDVGRAVAFYRDRLGFTETLRVPVDEPSFVVLELDGRELAIGAVDGIALHRLVRGRDAGNRVEICLYADDVDRAVHELRDAGASVLFEPADQPWGERAAYVADPDGNPVLLVTPLADERRATSG